MWKDPIVTETRVLREQFAAQFNHDMDAMFQDIQRRQHAAGKELFSFPPRKPYSTMALQEFVKLQEAA